MSLLIGPIRADLAVSDIQVCLLIGLAFALFYTCMGLPFGALADRANRKWLILGGPACWCVMTDLCGLAASFWLLFFCPMGVGVDEATLSPSASSMISDDFSKERLGRAILVYSPGIPVGSGLALAIAGVIVQTVTEAPPLALGFFGEVAAWRAVFLMVSAPGLLVAALLVMMQEPARRGGCLMRDEGGLARIHQFPQASWTRGLPSHRRCLPERRLVRNHGLGAGLA